MSDNQHTPGPWQVGARYSGNKVEIADASYDKVICTVWTHQFKGSTFEPDKQFQPLSYGEANARLIAAAPELLATLLNTTDALDQLMREGTLKIGHPYAPHVRNIIDNARAAIAKATGQ